MLVAPATFRRLCRARDILADPVARPSVRAVARAKELLASDASVTEACMEVGFSSLGTFSALFARRLGAPPATFRVCAQPAPPHDCFGAVANLPADAFRNFREA